MQDKEEAAHWKSVIKAYDGYMQYHLSANNVRRMAYLSLPKDAREIFEAIGYEDKLDAVDEGIRRNAEFIDEIIRDPVFADMLGDSDSGAHAHSHSHEHGPGQGHDHGHSHSHSHERSPPPPAAAHAHDAPSHSHDAPSPAPASGTSTPPPKLTQAQRDQGQDKVRSTLRSFVRDWAAEGKPERDAAYAPVLAALEREFPRASAQQSGGEGGAVGARGQAAAQAPQGSRGKVLVPGCGLGRLAMEIAALGFASQGNEFSTHMLLASNFVLNHSRAPNTHAIFPYLHSFSNHVSTHDLLRAVRVPDVVPAAILPADADFSLVAGDFEDVYGAPDQRGQWDAVVTCFFIDTARNVLNYLRIIHGLLRPGGKWINIGPLLWHFENSPPAKGEGSIELSLDEVKELATMVGFELTDERMVETTYTGMPDNMLRHIYTAAFWVATRVE
ncbi:hypothetical protein Q5752_001941 [Cryptotrichosporon argae]